MLQRLVERPLNGLNASMTIIGGSKVSDSDGELSDSQRHMLEQRLKAQCEGLSAEVRGEREDSQHERSRRTTREVQDRGDEATTEQWQEANAAMIDHHVDEIQSIKAALGRIEQGTYGYCVDCGDSIDFQRLEAYPSASRCLACQSKAESA